MNRKNQTALYFRNTSELNNIMAPERDIAIVKMPNLRKVPNPLSPVVDINANPTRKLRIGAICMQAPMIANVLPFLYSVFIFPVIVEQ